MMHTTMYTDEQLREFSETAEPNWRRLVRAALARDEHAAQSRARVVAEMRAREAERTARPLADGEVVRFRDESLASRISAVGSERYLDLYNAPKARWERYKQSSVLRPQSWESVPASAALAALSRDELAWIESYGFRF